MIHTTVYTLMLNITPKTQFAFLIIDRFSRQVSLQARVTKRSPSSSFEMLESAEKDRVQWFFDNLRGTTGLVFETSDVKAHRQLLTVRNHILQL